MNRKSAKILTVTGGFCCFLSVILFIPDFYKETIFPQSVSFFLLVAGIILIACSLAYYTEK
ncbi:MAG: hypothetical protein M3525_05820 [Acidobacteriota bacterium]|nr:hypothetical protein [Acidobacteriota bacterium]